MYVKNAILCFAILLLLLQMLAMAKAKARRKGREVTNSCCSAVFREIRTCFQTLACILKSFSMCFETLICMLKCYSVFCNTTTDAGKDKSEEEGKGGN